MFEFVNLTDGTDATACDLTDGVRFALVSYNLQVAVLADSELAALYRRAWVYASPSTYEGFGLPYVEAMACGVPVVATPNPGSLEVLGGGQYGRVVDDAVFSETVVHLLRDQQVRTSLVRAGLARAADYDIERTLDEYERLVRAMVTAHG